MSVERGGIAFFAVSRHFSFLRTACVCTYVVLDIERESSSIHTSSSNKNTDIPIPTNEKTNRYDFDN